MRDYESYEAPSTWPLWIPMVLWGLLLAGVTVTMLVLA